MNMQISDEWLEIQELTQLLKHVQCTKKNNKLPERHSVDLINFLVEKKHVVLIHTSDGKECYTEKRFIDEITGLVFTNGGRLSFLTINQITNVDYSIVEKYSKILIEENSSWQLLNDEIITKAYTDSIVQETQDLLNLRGIVTFDSICKKFAIPMDFMIKIFANNKGTLFGGNISTVNGGSFVSDFYLDIPSFSLRGFLLASSLPVKITFIAKTLKLDYEFVSKTIKELLSNNLVIGTVFNNVYFPSSTQSQVENLLLEEINSKMFIVNEYVEEISQCDPVTFLKHLEKIIGFKFYNVENFSLHPNLITKISSKLEIVKKSCEIFFIEEIINDEKLRSKIVKVVQISLKSLNLPSDYLENGLYLLEQEGAFFSKFLINEFKIKIEEILLSKALELLRLDEKFKNKLDEMKLLSKKVDDDSSTSKNKRKKDWRSKAIPQTNICESIIKEYFDISVFTTPLASSFSEIPLNIIEKIVHISFESIKSSISQKLILQLDSFRSEQANAENKEYSEPSKQQKEKSHKVLIKELKSNTTYKFNLLLFYKSSLEKIENVELRNEISKFIVSSLGSAISDDILRIFMCINQNGIQFSEEHLSLSRCEEKIPQNIYSSIIKKIPEQSTREIFLAILESVKSKNIEKFTSSCHRCSEKLICDLQIRTTLNSSLQRSIKKMHLDNLCVKLKKVYELKQLKALEYAETFNSLLSVNISIHKDMHLIFPGKSVSLLLSILQPLPDFGYYFLFTEMIDEIKSMLKPKSDDTIISHDSPPYKRLINLVDYSIKLVNEKSN